CSVHRSGRHAKPHGKQSRPEPSSGRRGAEAAPRHFALKGRHWNARHVVLIPRLLAVMRTAPVLPSTPVFPDLPNREVQRARPPPPQTVLLKRGPPRKRRCF